MGNGQPRLVRPDDAVASGSFTLGTLNRWVREIRERKAYVAWLLASGW